MIEYGHCLRERRGSLREDGERALEAFRDEKIHEKKSEKSSRKVLTRVKACDILRRLSVEDSDLDLEN